MHLVKNNAVSIQFDAAESNAARRMLLRLITEFGFVPRDKLGGFTATIHDCEYAIRFRLRADGGSELVAENHAAERLLPGIATGLTLEWQDPRQAPTGRRRAVRRREAELVGRLLGK